VVVETIYSIGDGSKKVKKEYIDGIVKYGEVALLTNLLKRAILTVIF
jgi:hypothetical protein